VPPAKLDLGSLTSYSPSWPFPVRLTLAIAVQYACMRCVQRAESIHQLLNQKGKANEGLDKDGDYRNDIVDDDLVERDEDGNVSGRLEGWERTQRIRKDNDLVMAWKEYTDKFITATCQHLGIAVETLPRECG
jgi:hypothetical protein